MSMHAPRPNLVNSRRQLGKTGTQQRNKDHLGSNSGPMGPEDKRKDKYGSHHNQDPLGLLSPETQEVREQFSSIRQRLQKRRRPGSR